MRTEEKVRSYPSSVSPIASFHPNAGQDRHDARILEAATSWLFYHLGIRTLSARRRLEEVEAGMGQEEEGLQYVSSRSTFSAVNYVLIFSRLKDTALEATGPKEAAELIDDLGVELDSPEHAQLERSHLCTRATGSRN